RLGERSGPIGAGGIRRDAHREGSQPPTFALCSVVRLAYLARTGLLYSLAIVYKNYPLPSAVAALSVSYNSVKPPNRPPWAFTVLVVVLQPARMVIESVARSGNTWVPVIKAGMVENPSAS